MEFDFGIAPPAEPDVFTQFERTNVLIPAKWTVERDSVLIEMWERGANACDIARKLGGVTKNAVIGRARRLRLGKHVESVEARRERRTERERLAPPKRKWGGVRVVKIAPIPLSFDAITDLPDEEIPIGQRRTFMELTAETCRWPVGEGEDMFFCGAQAREDGPYCCAHHRVAYRGR